MANIIEQQYSELTMAKKQSTEYNHRAKTIQSEWNNLIQENMQKDDSIKGLKLQIERNLDNLQLLTSDHDAAIYTLCKNVYEVIGALGDPAQKEASYFLINQLPLLQEERRAIIMENEQLHLSNQDLINQISLTKSNIDQKRSLFDSNINLDTAP